MYISLLLEQRELPQEAGNHRLAGKFQDIREFHISGDLLVVYRMDMQTLELLRTGAYYELFK